MIKSCKWISAWNADAELSVLYKELHRVFPVSKCLRSAELMSKNLAEWKLNLLQTPVGFWKKVEMKCVFFLSLSANRCKTPPTRNNTIVSVSSTERLHGTSVLRNRVSMKVAYRVGSVLKYRCKRGFLLQVSLGPTARPASEQLRVTTRRVRRIPLLESQHIST